MHEHTNYVVCNRAEFGSFFEGSSQAEVLNKDFEAITVASSMNKVILDPKSFKNIAWNTQVWDEIIDWTSSYPQKEDSQQRSEDLVQQIKTDGFPHFSSLLERAMEDGTENAEIFKRRATELAEKLQGDPEARGIVDELTKTYQSHLKSYNFTLDVIQGVKYTIGL
ncbi:hypothetical protein FOXB_07495 [Fusarium oxysporum f. sp. conglutinans Fo5176]|uniref:Uncharacterized protein n=1 Tax=Fusarium oxysporum (strain Fo5176) TaxID=660025 RepID=F9FM65_FUSOF|nr:hypothetical protein FOXB_07495 [Fusarium oxysporum f. sp. conglutinans Fo5176]